MCSTKHVIAIASCGLGSRAPRVKDLERFLVASLLCGLFSLTREEGGKAKYVYFRHAEAGCSYCEQL
jgi:hypothetical protein